MVSILAVKRPSSVAISSWQNQTTQTSVADQRLAPRPDRSVLSRSNFSNRRSAKKVRFFSDEYKYLKGGFCTGYVGRCRQRKPVFPLSTCAEASSTDVAAGTSVPFSTCAKASSTDVAAGTFISLSQLAQRLHQSMSPKALVPFSSCAKGFCSPCRRETLSPFSTDQSLLQPGRLCRLGCKQ